MGLELGSVIKQNSIMKELKIIIAGAEIKTVNRGCTALSISTMFLLDELLSRKNISYKFYLPNSGFADNEYRTYKIGEKEIGFYPWKYPISDLKSFLKAVYKKQNPFKFKRIYKNADFILDLGLGDSFADIYGKARFDKIDKIHVLARKYKKPYCILPQTIGPFSNENIKQLANKSISNASLVMARDKQSLDYVLQNVPNQKKIAEYIDVAFFMPYEKENISHDLTNVGISISDLLWRGGYTGHNEFGLLDDYQKVIRHIIHFFLKKENVRLHLVGHVVNGERWSENDYALCYDLSKEYNNPRIICAPYFLGPIEAKNYIASLDFFMGARMHATIAAFSSGVPVVPMAYSRKFNGLFEQTLQYPYMIDMKVDTIETMISKLDESFSNRIKLKEIVTNRINTIVEERRKLLIKNLESFLEI